MFLSPALTSPGAHLIIIVTITVRPIMVIVIIILILIIIIIIITIIYLRLPARTSELRAPVPRAHLGLGERPGYYTILYCTVL